jgi:hypothetical protein
MPRMESPAAGAFYGDGDRHWSDQDLLNMLAVRAERGGTRTQFKLRQGPGLRPDVQIGTGKIRGMRNVEGKLFVVSGAQLYQISPTGVAIPRGTIPGTARVSMSHNQYGGGNQLIVVNGSAGYVYDTTALTLTKITDEGYPGAFIAGYVDQYLAQVEPQGRYWFHSDLADATAYSTLDQYEAEADPDRIVSLHVSHREVLIFGKDTIEPFVNTGAQTGTFERASNTVIECGCAARFSVAGMDNSVFWLDDKRIVRRLDGYTPIRISNAGIEQALAECTPEAISRAYAFTWEDRGHKVYYLTVPGYFTFGYDLLSGEWHRRSSPGKPTWRLSDLVFWEGRWIGGDAATGRLYELDWNYCFDGTEELVREWSTGVLTNQQRRIECNELEVLCSVGGELDTVGSFPAQPEGPTISGDPPDGVVGQAYTYRFTATGGTPPYTFSARSGTPPGLEQETDGDLTGAFTTAGTYASVVTRVTDATGLWDEITNEIVVRSVTWIIGPLTMDVGGTPTVGYLRTTDPEDWSAAPVALPSAFGELCTLVEANARVWCVGSTTDDDAYLSVDAAHGWTPCNTTLSFASTPSGQGVWFNGTYYFRQHMRSLDGEAWAEVPNSPQPGTPAYTSVAYTPSGAVMMSFNTAGSGNYLSTDDGATWTSTGLPYGTAIWLEFGLEGGGRIWTTNNSDGPAYTDDYFDTSVSNSGIGPNAGYFYRSGTWLAYRGTDLKRTTGTSTAWAVVRANASGVAPVVKNMIAEDRDGNIYALELGASNELRVLKSTDDGLTWTVAATISTVSYPQNVSFIKVGA